MKVILDSARCEGHGRCLLVSTELFEMDENGHSHLLLEDAPESLRWEAETAAKECPAHAISVAD